MTSNKPRRRWLRRLLWLPVWLLLISVLQVLTLRWIDPPTSSFMLIRQVEAMRAGDADFELRQQWRDLAEISPQLPIALVAAEDQKFPRHRGFDLAAIDQARTRNARGGRIRGASTISQQVAKNLFLWSGGGYVRKGIEAWYTLLIELLWSKQRILEVYANIAEFGDGVYGAEAAAQTYFGKPASALSAAECARLAAVLPNPRKYSARNPGPYVQRRAAWVQRQMRQLGGPAYLEAEASD
jgi:monofunctional biosynthetic peptidoglycan transglycosylase